ncbi:MAG: phosphoglycerate dehydrogenase [Chloroflexi bacterium]|nr:phosphoglycerate dehydrogenase [Chloroflexota bacterium]
MAKFRVVVTGLTFRRIAGTHEQRLVDAGCEFVPSPFPRAATEEELLPLIKGVDAVLASTDAFTRRVFESADRLKIISRFGVGHDSIDVDAAADHGVWVTITPGTNEHSVADHTMAMLLALARDVVPLVEQTRAGGWERTIGLELRDLTLGLIGFGRIGRQVATRARAFGMDVVIYDVYQDTAAAAELGARYVSLDELLGSADIVSLHAPATPQTRDVINAETLAKMKPSACLINTARGELVDEADLAAALRNGRIAGAALDVFKQEPPAAGHPLLGLPNVLPTPHIAGITKQSGERMATLSVDNILAVLRGERPPHPVNEPRRVHADDPDTP